MISNDLINFSNNENMPTITQMTTIPQITTIQKIEKYVFIFLSKFLGIDITFFTEKTILNCANNDTFNNIENMYSSYSFYLIILNNLFIILLILLLTIIMQNTIGIIIFSILLFIFLVLAFIYYFQYINYKKNIQTCLNNNL